MISTCWRTISRRISRTRSRRDPASRSPAPRGTRRGRRLPEGLLAALLGLLLATAPSSAGEATEEARAVVDRTAEEVLEILRAPDLTQAQRRERIEAIAYERFDFETMSKLVMARNWRRLDKGQRQEFVEAFKEYLSRSYGSRIERYDQGGVEITGDRLEPRGDVTVRTMIVGGDADGVVVDYRLRRRDEDWRVIDVVIEGVSLVSSYRDQFGEVMNRDGADGLLEQLREKNAAPPPGLGSEA